MKFAVVAIALLLPFASDASAQWARYPDTSIPRTRDGKADLTAKTPKARDGKPELSGVWQSDPDPAGLPKGVPIVESIHETFAIPRYFIDVTADTKPSEGLLQPAAAAAFMQNLQSGGKNDPVAHCKPTGVPAVANLPIPFKIVQTEKLVLMLYEDASVFRQIFLDARKTVQDPQPRWMGYSTGKWEGDTLVVDSVGFTDKSWLDRLGHTHSDAMRVTERYRRKDFGHLEIEVTIDDPKTFTRPIKYTQRATLVPDEDLLEYFCTENEKDAQHYR
jgi:hypothetical protein